MPTRLAVTFLIVSLSAPLGAQDAPQGARQPQIPSNIRLDLTITDNYTEPPSTKTVTMLVMSGQLGRIRTSNQLAGHDVELNVDAHVSQIAGGAFSLALTFEYTPSPDPTGMSRSRPAKLHESLTVVLRDKQKLMISQSADPATDRKVTVEVTATVLQ